MGSSGIVGTWVKVGLGDTVDYWLVAGYAFLTLSEVKINTRKYCEERTKKKKKRNQPTLYGSKSSQ